MQLTYIYVHACKHRYSVTRSVKADYKDIFKLQEAHLCRIWYKTKLIVNNYGLFIPAHKQGNFVNDKSGPRTAIIKNGDKR